MATIGRAWLAALLAGALGMACAADPSMPEASMSTSDTVKLSLGQAPAATLDGIRLALVDLQDQRCPVDVQCVWAGYAQVTLEAHLPGDPGTVRVVVGTGGPTGTRIPGDAELGAYRLSLVALEPRPSQKSPVPPSACVASVRVARR